jgi:molecular chaperone GrpE
MADSEDKNDDDLEGQADQEVDQEVDGNQGAASESEATPELDPEAQLAALRAEVEALKDQALRGQAEAENIRRRTARDVENAHKFALEKFASDLLPVIDSLEKAVESAQNGEESTDAGAIGEGVSLSLKLFLDVLEKAGISQIRPMGEPFDPQLHEAMAMVENPDAEPNSVLDVMQAGYTLNGRLIRAAMVVVSKAPAGE